MVTQRTDEFNETPPPKTSTSQTNRGHFEHLSKDPKEPGKYYMYQRHVDRTPEETSQLITDVLSMFPMGNMVVNRTGAPLVDPKSLTSEAINQFDNTFVDNMETAKATARAVDSEAAAKARRKRPQELPHKSDINNIRG